VVWVAAVKEQTERVEVPTELQILVAVAALVMSMPAVTVVQVLSSFDTEFQMDFL
jgi:hypothetical protein